MPKIHNVGSLGMTCLSLFCRKKYLFVPVQVLFTFLFYFINKPVNGFHVILCWEWCLCVLILTFTSIQQLGWTRCQTVQMIYIGRFPYFPNLKGTGKWRRILLFHINILKSLEEFDKKFNFAIDFIAIFLLFGSRCMLNCWIWCCKRIRRFKFECMHK